MFFNRKDRIGRPAKNTQRAQSIRWYALCVFFFVFAVSFNKHEYHASVTNMQYDPKERVFEVSVRMFTDDLEKTLTKENGGQRVIFDKKYEKNNDVLVERYVRKHFALQTAQKQRKPFTYVGHETEAEAQWIYLELPYPESLRGATLQQSVLMDMFDDQANLVTVNYNEQKKTFLFKKSQTVQEISF